MAVSLSLSCSTFLMFLLGQCWQPLAATSLILRFLRFTINFFYQSAKSLLCPFSSCATHAPSWWSKSFFVSLSCPVLFRSGQNMLTKCSARRTSTSPLQWHMDHRRLPHCQGKSLLCHLCPPGSNKITPFALKKLKFIVGCLNLHSILQVVIQCGLLAPTHFVAMFVCERAFSQYLAAWHHLQFFQFGTDLWAPTKAPCPDMHTENTTLFKK